VRADRQLKPSTGTGLLPSVRLCWVAEVVASDKPSAASGSTDPALQTRLYRPGSTDPALETTAAHATLERAYAHANQRPASPMPAFGGGSRQTRSHRRPTSTRDFVEPVYNARGWRADDRGRDGPGRGKSELHRAGRRVTPGEGNLRESATEKTQPAATLATVKWWGKSPPAAG
jgi:hypothetical protein